MKHDEPGGAVNPDTEGGVTGEKRLPSLDQRFWLTGTEFTDRFDALRETHTELSKAAANLDHFGSIWDNLPAGVEISSEDKQRVVARIRSIPKDAFTARKLLDALWDVTSEDAWGPAFATATMAKFYRPRREPIFHGALLISAVASLEAHLGQLAENYYRAAPAALHDVPKEALKEFSLKDLQTLGSIDQAIEAAIDSRVNKLSFGSLSDWRKFFKDRMSIDLADQGTTWSQLLEIFERRHCLVHSEGQASDRYVKATGSSRIKSDLRPDRDYVSNAIDALEIMGTLLQASVWHKFTKNADDIFTQLQRVAFGALSTGRWAFALPLFERCGELPLSNENRLITRVNTWLARKGLSGLDSIRRDVEEWDVSGVDELYVFAKACILGDVDAAFAQLPGLVERDKLSGAALATWPLTAPLRTDPRIREYGDLVRGYLSTEIEESELEAEIKESESATEIAESEAATESADEPATATGRASERPSGNADSGVSSHEDGPGAHDSASFGKDDDLESTDGR